MSWLNAYERALLRQTGVFLERWQKDREFYGSIALYVLTQASWNFFDSVPTWPVQKKKNPPSKMTV
jgi:hypothetical protein